jgi:predicted RNase H-like HicB family nuclease
MPRKVIAKTKTGGDTVKSYVFPVVLEPDADAWHVYVPKMESEGAATWGKTREEALRNIQEVMEMIVAEYLEEGRELPGYVTVRDQPAVAVNIQ